MRKMRLPFIESDLLSTGGLRDSNTIVDTLLCCCVHIDKKRTLNSLMSIHYETHLKLVLRNNLSIDSNSCNLLDLSFL
jgi:hypothetical protein